MAVQTGIMTLSAVVGQMNSNGRANLKITPETSRKFKTGK